MDVQDEQNSLDPDCAVCLQKCYHPTRLPCGHVFCFLCVKGVAIQSRKCAMCRAIIPADYLDHPILLENISQEELSAEVEHDYQWYYEGRNGWWKYDERSNCELESAFNDGESVCTLLLAGALYSIDFQSMTQMRCTDHTRRRKVKRDNPSFPAKGIAGIKTHIRPEQDKSDDESAPPVTNNNEQEVLEVPQESNSDSSQDDNVNNILEQISNINLADAES